MTALATSFRAAPTAPATPPVADTAGGRAFRARAVAFGFAAAALPLITPHGPANTSVADAGIALCVGLVLLAAAVDGTTLRLPYLLGVTLIVLAGALSALLAGAHLESALALVQDVAMLAWGAAVANAGRDPRLLGVMLHSWVVAATGYAALVTIGMSTGIDALAGRTEAEGFRASFTLGDPNVSGNYFLISFFLVRACQWPRARPARWATEVLLLVAVAFSGSNGALVGLVAGTLLAMLVRLWRVRDPVAAVGLVAALCLGGLTLGPDVHPESLQRWAADSVPLLRDGVGRSDRSSQERTQLATEGMRLWLEGDLAGIGPAQTKTTFERELAPYVKEAHNDYLAALVERGLLGIVGLVVLLASVAVRVSRASSGRLRAGFSDLLPRPELLVSAVVAMALAALFYEVLHFRHLWALLGVIAATELWGRRP